MSVFGAFIYIIDANPSDYQKKTSRFGVNQVFASHFGVKNESSNNSFKSYLSYLIYTKKRSKSKVHFPRTINFDPFIKIHFSSIQLI